jgi:C4-dicarboxylate-binding protein DctP
MKRLFSFLLMVMIITTAVFAGGQGEAPAAASEDEASAKVFVFKYSNSQSDNAPRSKSMVFFKDKLEKASNGRIQVELFFNGVLGTEAEVFEMVQLGTVQGCRGGLFERANKKFLLYTLPFLFENADQVVGVMRSDFGQKINKGALANGVYIPATGVAGGMRNITNSVRPIKTPADLAGLKMRTPPIESTLLTFQALKANPQQVAYTETYMALKSGVVDGQENPFSNAVDMKFYEAQKYLSVVNWQVHPDPFYVNPEWYNSLPEDLKAVFDSVAEATMQYSDTIWLNSEEGYYNILKEKLEVNEITPEARARFVEAVQSVWKYYIDKGNFTRAEIDEALAIAAK